MSHPSNNIYHHKIAVKKKAKVLSWFFFCSSIFQNSYFRLMRCHLICQSWDITSYDIYICFNSYFHLMGYHPILSFTKCVYIDFWWTHRWSPLVWYKAFRGLCFTFYNTFEHYRYLTQNYWFLNNYFIKISI